MISLDLITLNGDRALNNVGILRNNETGELYFSPCFDNGDALLSLEDYDSYSEEEFDYVDEDVMICTFGVSDNQDYIDLIQNNGGPFLEINKEALLEDLKNYSNDLYDRSLVERNKKLIEFRLNKFEGIIYKNVS